MVHGVDVQGLMTSSKYAYTYSYCDVIAKKQNPKLQTFFILSYKTSPSLEVWTSLELNRLTSTGL